MSATYRSVYDDESISLQWDRTSHWALAAGTSISATNFQTMFGASHWTVHLPDAVTGAAGGKVGTLVVQINNTNPIVRGDRVGNIKWTVNPLQNQPTQGNKNVIIVNSGFTANWISIGTVGGGVSLTAFQIPARYVRLFGVGVTGLASGVSAAVLFSNVMSQGN